MAGDTPRANLQPLSLHVPEPKFRPGDTVDFTSVDIPAADATRRPDTADAAMSFTDLAYGLVRVLDENGQAVGAWNPRLSPDLLRRMLRSMALTRAFDECHVPCPAPGQDQLLHEERLGEEAVSIGCGLCARPATIWCFPSYRQQGHPDRARLERCSRHDEPDLFGNKRRPAAGASNCRSCIRRKTPASSRSRAISRRNFPRRSAGRWPAPREG